MLGRMRAPAGVMSRVAGYATRLAPYGLAAAGVAAAGYGGYRLYKNLKAERARRMKAKQSKVKRLVRYNTTGTYGGKFNKVSRSGARSVWDSYNKTGVVSVNEIIGSVTDNDAVYIVNEAINSRDVIYYIAAAVIRRLIEMAGGRVTGNTEPSFSITHGSTESNQFTIRLEYANTVTGGSGNLDYGFVSTTEFQDIVEHYRNIFEQYCSGYGELNNQNTDEFVRIYLFQGAAENGVIRSQMYFNETFVDIKGTAEVKVQNRTKATGGSEDAENINSNPLQGRAYLFQGVPKPKGNQYNIGGTNGSMFPFERMPYTSAVSKFGGNTAGFNVNMKEPPNAKQFWNCSKASKIRLEPGQIKSFWVSQQKSGNVLHILKRIRLQLDASGAFSNYSIFKVQMLAFEDVINANAAETISVQYEVERKLGVKVFTKQKKYYKTEYHLVT